MPFQSWRPQGAEVASPAIAIWFLANPLPALALAYLIRSRPDGLAREVCGAALALTAVYAAALSLVQVRPRRWLGWFSTALWSLAGSGATSVPATVVTIAGLSLVLLALEDRAGALDLARHHGFGAAMPRLATGYLVFVLMSCFGHEAHGVPLVIASALLTVSAFRTCFALLRGAPAPAGSWPDATRREQLTMGALVAARLLLCR